MTAPITTLPWLPQPPADFRDLCKNLTGGTDARFLATHALDLTQLGQLAKAMKKQASLAPLTPFKLAILSNSTADFLAEPTIATAARHGIALDVMVPPFGQVVQQALDPTSEIHKAKADAVLLALDHRFLAMPAVLGDQAAMSDAIEKALQQITSLRDGLRKSGATVIVCTIARPPLPLFGHLDAKVAGTERAFIDAFNLGLIESLRNTPDVLFDVAALAETVGLAAWHDAPQWLVAKIPFTMDCVPLFADHVARIVASLRGKARKCLVLDLDNTVWGGIIGDDGMDGIKIGNGSPAGEAHLDIQRMALALRQRGIVLAVSSKNDDTIARTPFKDHPDMLLREDHIAVFQANWQDKATNLKAIAETLNIGIDALVFLDDNPAERALVRRELPQVAVPEVPADPAWYPQMLMYAGYFEAIGFSDEDRQRAEQYQANAKRAELSAAATDLPAYLRSLQMVINFAPFDDIGRARIAQLINKSNQFNLTTRRYTETQVAEMQDNTELFTLQVRLADAFGDNGMISVIICRPDEEQTWLIDSWLMSCRVLKRNVEQAVLNEIVANARTRNIKTIKGLFVPTEKNIGLVKDHYSELGFTLVHDDNGTTHWTLDVATYQPYDVPMTVERGGTALADVA
ncbi:MAG: HAD-IIIC family phosphatase [Bdellovibrionales bacterium]